jgi:peptidoglycan/xylan/chitin deacetylase (PgdA/CDA1 family)
MSQKILFKIFFYLIGFGLIISFLGLVCFTAWPEKNFSNHSLKLNRKATVSYYDHSAFVKPAGLKRSQSTLDQTKAINLATTTPEIKIPILMYHYIEKTLPKESAMRQGLTVDPKIFEEQLKTLTAAGFKFYFVKDIPGIISGKNKADSKNVVLTFDDGYKDFYEQAFPLIKKYQVKATVYVITNTIGSPAYLNELQIKALIDSGLVEIGSHTLDHVKLRAKNFLEQKRQIEESKIRLEKMFGLKIYSLAYPYGSFSADSVAITEKAGYTCAVSVLPGKMQSTENLFYLSRLRPRLRIGQALIDFINK